jgi:hypothetical protein
MPAVGGPVEAGERGGEGQARVADRERPGVGHGRRAERSEQLLHGTEVVHLLVRDRVEVAGQLERRELNRGSERGIRGVAAGEGRVQVLEQHDVLDLGVS